MALITGNLENYFTEQKKILKSKNRKKHFVFFISFLITSMLLSLAGKYYLINPTNIDEKTNSLITNFFFGISIFMSFFYWLIISQSVEYNILKNKDEVNLYEALQYLYRDDNTDNTEALTNLVDAEYEERRLAAILKKVSPDKAQYAKDVEAINEAFNSKTQTVSAISVLKEDM